VEIEESVIDSESLRVDPKVYELYLQGRYWASKFREEDLLKARSFFERAVAQDSRFSSAWAGLADSLVMLGLFYGGTDVRLAEAEIAARRALDLDPRTASAYAALSDIAGYRWEWAKAEALAQRALELDPNSAQAYRRYWLILAPHRRFGEARAALEQAKKLDPLNAQIASNLGLQFMLEGRWEEAEETLLTALQLDPDYTLTHGWLWGVYSVQNRDPERGRELSKYLQAMGYGAFVPELEEKIGTMGYESALRTIALRMDREFSGQIGHLGVVAGLLSEAGETERALKWLRQGAETRSWTLAWLAVSTDYRRLHGNPEFEALLRKLDLPPTAARAADVGVQVN
jgi:Flp pilus assembly protein TadD